MPSLSLTTPSTFEPVSLAEAKDHVRVTSSDDEGILAGYLFAARAHCEKYTGRAFATKTYTQTFDYGWPTIFNRPTVSYRSRITLERPPVQSVASITYVDTNGATQTLSPSLYQFSKGDIFGIIEPTYGSSWPAVRAQMDTVTVQFIAGYGSNPSDTPESIRMAILMLVGHFYANREPIAVDVRGTPVELPLSVTALLADYTTDNWV